MRTIEVEVTQDDIYEGQRSSCHSCPVAKAIIRAGVAKYPSVYGHMAMLRNSFTTFGLRILMPNEAYDFIQTFDELGPDAVEPISFQLTVPDEIP